MSHTAEAIAVTTETAKKVGLLPEEFEKIKEYSHQKLLEEQAGNVDPDIDSA